MSTADAQSPAQSNAPDVCKCPPSRWRARAVKNRPGWERVTCADCSRFLGYRLIQTEPELCTDKPKRRPRKTNRSAKAAGPS